MTRFRLAVRREKLKTENRANAVTMIFRNFPFPCLGHRYRYFFAPTSEYVNNNEQTNIDDQLFPLSDFRTFRHSYR